MISSSLGAFRASSLRLASTRSPVLVLQIPRHRLLSTLIVNRSPRPQPDTRWRNARWNSSAAPSASVPILPTSPPEAPLPEAPPPEVSPLDSFVSDSGMVVDTIASIPPLQHGDFHALGLCHWTPPGLVQYSFELVNILTGLPWFHTFIAATLFWRLVLVPFAIIGTRHSSRMRPQTGKLNEASAAMQAARAAGDTVAMQRASLQAAKIRSDADVSMAGLMAPMVQLPISLGMFIGIKRMCELPVMQLTQSGVEWLPDLTQPGPYYILPILVAVSGNMMISMSRREMDPSRPSMGHIMNGFRVLTLITIPWMNFFPSGLLLSLLVTSVTGVVQTAALRIPAIRTALSIPEWTPPPPGTLPTMKDTFNEYINPFTKNKRQQQSPLSSQMIVKPYIPLKTPEPLKTVAPSTTAAAATSAAAPPSLEVMAQQAQAHPSVKASSLFEKDSPAPAPKSPKPSKGAKKVKAKRA